MNPELLDSALSLACNCGKRAGLNVEDTEDCAVHFAQWMLTTKLPAPPLGAWMRKCARNHVINYLRGRRVRLMHECHWPETVSDKGQPVKWDCQDESPGVEAELLQDELWRLLMAGLAELAPVPQQVFLSHHLYGESAEEIALSSDRTPHAIEQSLCRSRKHVRAALIRRGSTEAELRQYLAGDPGPLLRWHSPDPEY